MSVKSWYVAISWKEPTLYTPGPTDRWSLNNLTSTGWSQPELRSVKWLAGAWRWTHLQTIQTSLSNPTLKMVQTIQDDPRYRIGFRISAQSILQKLPEVSFFSFAPAAVPLVAVWILPALQEGRDHEPLSRTGSFFQRLLELENQLLQMTSEHQETDQICAFIDWQNENGLPKV